MSFKITKECLRTKRRKIQKEIRFVEETILKSNSSQLLPISSPENTLINHNDPIILSEYNNPVDNKNSFSYAQLNNSNNVLPPISISEETDTENTERLNSNSQFSIKEFIANWAIDFKIPHNAVNGLLKGLKRHDCFNDLPIDCRTILRTPICKSKEIRSVNPGFYHHFGLEKGIQLYAPRNLQHINIAIGIDGLPISKSSTTQFWPILASILVEPPLKRLVFLVGLYCGNEKPKNSNDYLSDFVMEAKNLELNGVIINEIVVKVAIKVFCCDVPAKAFILMVKGHSGFSSCTRCTIEGEYVCNRVCFPYSQVKASERNHSAYLNIEDEEYHLRNEISILTELESFNAVTSFSLDYMHLVCLGVCKKLINLWTKGPLNVRLQSSKINNLSSLLLASNSYLPSDFSRKSRGLQDLCRWKATEYRLFLLYTGPVVLKNIVSVEIYTNFMVLNIAILILLSPDRKFLLQYARQLLNFFVENFQDIYGQKFVSHNVHALLHLCDDYDKFGPLDNCSAFCFENFMKELKSNIRKHEKPLEQVVNRFSEKYEYLNGKPYEEQQVDQPILKHVHDNGPLIDNDLPVPQQFYTFISKSITIKIKKESDSFILTKNKEIVQCMNFVKIDNIIMILGKQFNLITPFYEDPFDSTIIEIFEVKELSNQLRCWAMSDIKKKMMVVFQHKKKVAMPIIHTEV